MYSLNGYGTSPNPTDLLKLQDVVALTVQTVPEPSPLLAALMVLAGVITAMRRASSTQRSRA